MNAVFIFNLVATTLLAIGAASTGYSTEVISRAVVLIVIGGLVFANSSAALRHITQFGSASRIVLAALVTASALTGLICTAHVFQQPTGAEVGSPRDAIIAEATLLLVGLALALAVLLVAIALVSIWAWLSGRFADHSPSNGEGPGSITASAPLQARGAADDRIRKHHPFLSRREHDDSQRLGRRGTKPG